MIRFACPRCKTVLERPEQEAGGKFACPTCGQRLQTPQSLNKTLLGDVKLAAAGQGLIEEASPASASEARIQFIRGRQHVVWPCPLCQTQVSVALDLRQSEVRCPQCAKKIDVPTIQAGTSGGVRQIKAGPAAAPPPPEPPPRSRERDRGGDDWDEDGDLRPRRRRDRWDDDRGIRRPLSGRPGDEHECARSATTGFLCSLISVGLLFVALIVWVVVVAERPRGGEINPFVFLILILGLVSFVLGLIGTVFSSRGLDPINRSNRGFAVAGLVCGIIGMVLGLIGSAFFFCVGMVLMSAPW